MTAKPSTLYTFATDTTYTSGPAVGTATKTVPSAGLMAQGYHPADEPSAQEHNALFNNLFLWCAFVNALFDSSGRLLQLQEDIYQWVSALGATLSNAVHDSSDAAIRSNGSLATASNVPQVFKVGDVIDQLAVYVKAADSATDPSNQLVVQLSVLHGAGTPNPVGYTGVFGTGQIVVNAEASPAWKKVTLDISPPYTVPADTSFSWSAIWQNGTTGKVQSFGARVKTP